MYAATAKGIASDLAREHKEITAIRPNVATNSLNASAQPGRACTENEYQRRPNITCASNVPARPPTTCALTYHGTSRHAKSPDVAAASVTAGFKCAPEIGAKEKISATSAAPVANAFASNAIATLPPASCSPMIPEPTTAATRNSVPPNSQAVRRAKLNFIVFRFVRSRA